ncbi:MAG: aspartate carbamoyltransferase [Candidatus Kerfeldbacteria bacterium]|nr:aspartate carbamoyltransferase [Candidatus Kerfeldbacteria bacterium]
MKNNTFSDILGIEQFSAQDLLSIIDRARLFTEKGIPSDVLRGAVVGPLFFEPSTRTRLSFEAAVHRLGGSVIGFENTESTSITKGETFEDTIRMVDGYVDFLVVRHPEAGAAQRAASVAEHAVINAGDGAHEHPTQSLLDLFTIAQSQGSLEKPLKIAFVGDLKYGRVPHSDAKALALFSNIEQYWVAPDALRMPDDVRAYVQSKGVTVVETADVANVLPEADIVVMTRVQKERFADVAEYEKVKDVYILTPEMCMSIKKSMRILHPLPRRYEIPESIDALPQAYYFQQARFGVPVRAALLSLIVENQ